MSTTQDSTPGAATDRASDWITDAAGNKASTGCFTGSRDQFVAAVAETHVSGKFRAQYDLAIALADCSIVSGVPDESEKEDAA